MNRRRFQRHRRETTQDDGTTQVDARELSRMFAAPGWLQDLGMVAWFLVGLGLVFVGAIWILGATSTIVIPVVAGTIVAAVAGPGVSWLQRHGLPRAVSRSSRLTCRSSARSSRARSRSPSRWPRREPASRS